jgi:hypothetical protein
VHNTTAVSYVGMPQRLLLGEAALDNPCDLCWQKPVMMLQNALCPCTLSQPNSPPLNLLQRRKLVRCTVSDLQLQEQWQQQQSLALPRKRHGRAAGLQPLLNNARRPVRTRNSDSASDLTTTVVQSSV